MTRATITGAAVVTATVLIALTYVALNRVEPTAATSPAIASSPPAASPSAAALHSDLLYGRITTTGGDTHEGRLRWGRDQEAFWGDYFNGLKSENRWLVHAPQERPKTERRKIEIFGLQIGGENQSRYRRLFMARFGDIARIDAHVRDVQVTLKSGTVVALDRFAAGDIDDGVRVWDGAQVVDFDARRIRAIEFLPKAARVAVPGRLHGTVRTRQGTFIGFIRWNEQDGFSGDELDGRTADRETHLRYDTIRSIARRSSDSVLVSLLDGREVVLNGSRDTGRGNRGIYVDDGRYGRVLVSWDAFDRVDFSPGVSGPAYDDFVPGRPLAGSVTTRDGRRLAGRLVYDFDESETTETFDASFQDVDYNIPFSLIASIVPAVPEGDDAQRARVILRDGEELQFERAGDVSDGNAGLLIFVEGRELPEYVPWANVAQIDLDAPSEGR